MTEDNEKLPVDAVFKDRHGIGLIGLINREHGNIKTELEDRLGITDKTVRGLLTKAIKAGLIKQITHKTGDHPRSDRYVLTHRGKSVQSLIRGLELHQMYLAYMDLIGELEAATDDIKGLVEAEGLDEKYKQADSWEQSSYDSDVATELFDDDPPSPLGDNESGNPHPDASGEQPDPDIIDEDDNRTEVWGDDGTDDES